MCLSTTMWGIFLRSPHISDGLALGFGGSGVGVRALDGVKAVEALVFSI